MSVTRTNTSAGAKGCKRGYSYRASIAVTMTDETLLRWAHEVTGLGAICLKKSTGINHKDAWAWTVWSKEAAALAREVLPFIRLKKPQVNRLIEFQELMRQPGTKGLSDEEWNAREDTWRAFRLLNFRGVVAQ